jgi:hypothetical protein
MSINSDLSKDPAASSEGNYSKKLIERAKSSVLDSEPVEGASSVSGLE